ncbi:recombinase family protein [Bradyrhizobium guangdongense]|uniref:recombinase family protein n=1 Tax=Bradyrhizobium guangdongense TaxID=1325090 RepID=UPI00112B4B69|nr:recombinase family protein [Bradyrhizobium guangdongense]TPQ31534.1 recombinase family protein [Bradyrhizobium guangdongense]
MGTALTVPKARLPRRQEQSLRAAQYVRMSTDYQQYSIENQAAVIAAFAQAHGLKIVRTYRDDAESGLRIRNRAGLTNLIDDVRRDRTDFDHILVYDVSRWGRFQDVDESAHYEFLCREAGISVCYCAEQFENDGSLISGIVKNIKRVMAAEYSRELSIKVHAGACRLSSLGFRQGGQPCFGLRRELIDAGGRSRGLLERGQRKSLQTDRVVLRRGPPEEVETVKFIFDRFVNGHRPEKKIARELNARGVLNRGQAWTFYKVQYLLQNENYVGTSLYNRSSFRLRGVRKKNPPALWVRKEGAFEPIIEPELFEQAQQIFVSRRKCRGLSNEEMLKRLRIVLQRKGRLSRWIIENAENVPSASLYQLRFGSLRKTYRLIGYSPERDYEYVDSRTMRRNLVKDLVLTVGTALARSGEDVRVDQVHQVLNVRARAISFRVVRGWHDGNVKHSPTWTIRRGRYLPPGLIVVVRLDNANKAVRDYFLMPASRLPGARAGFTEGNAERFGMRRFETADRVIRAIKRHFANERNRRSLKQFSR